MILQIFKQVASPSVLRLNYTDTLLDRLVRRCSKEIGKNVQQTYTFDLLFQSALQKAERKAEAAKETRPFEEKKADPVSLTASASSDVESEGNKKRFD